MLEWYVAGFNYQQLMNHCEEMIINVAANIGYTDIISYKNRRISLASPWEKITVRKAFEIYAPLTVDEALNQDCFDEILVECIEPNLGNDKPSFLYDYPASLGALARIKKENNSIAERFELYIGGLELANGFSELTDAAEQRRRFEEAQKFRSEKNYATYPMPEKFLIALQEMPEAAGIAMGIDRLAMIFAGVESIDDVVVFSPETL
jgi:lysyl-tRNA synthetase class 2